MRTYAKSVERIMGAARSKKKEEKLIRVTFMGAGRVGKTCLIHRMMNDRFVERYIPTIGDIFMYSTKVHGNNVSLEISDMSGQYVFPAMMRRAIETTDVVVVVFSVDKTDSLQTADRLCREVTSNGLPVLLVCNKSDIMKPHDVVSSYFKNNDVIMTSAKQDKRDSLLKRIYEEYEVKQGSYRTSQSSPPLKTRLHRLIMIAKSTCFSNFVQSSSGMKRGRASIKGRSKDL